jgi:hypothetical protein
MNFWYGGLLPANGKLLVGNADLCGFLRQLGRAGLALA